MSAPKTETSSFNSNNIVAAVESQVPVAGYTHGFYRYPARFSPLIPREMIRAFTSPGDVVLDPFMGGGTTLVEAMCAGRIPIGADLNSLAVFLTNLKTTTLSENDLGEVSTWAADVLPSASIHAGVEFESDWEINGYHRNLPWRHRKVIELVLQYVDELPRMRQQRFARGVLLRLGQWALDCRQTIPDIGPFREEFFTYLNQFERGMREFRTAVFDNRLPDGRKPVAICIHRKASELGDTATRFQGKVKLVVTSPPYPGVYVLYHRWKVQGRRESPAPYWVADCLDGKGQTHYCFGDRRKPGLDEYFTGIRDSFIGVRPLLSSDAIVVQVISFKEPKWQLPAFLSAMNEAGYEEKMPSEFGITAKGRLRRMVPGRRWFALMQGELATSEELVLFHTPTV